MAARPETKECPFCRESIQPGAIKCRHCDTDLPEMAAPEHGGTCPACREAIHPQALKCHHCKTTLVPALLMLDGPMDPPPAEGDGETTGVAMAGRHPSTTVSVPGPGGVWTCRRYWKCTRMALMPAGPNYRTWQCIEGHWDTYCWIS